MALIFSPPFFVCDYVCLSHPDSWYFFANWQLIAHWNFIPSATGCEQLAHISKSFPPVSWAQG
jgi:hypothetical protein